MNFLFFSILNLIFHNNIVKVVTATRSILKYVHQSRALICEVAGLSKWFRSGVRKENIATSMLVIPTTVTSSFRRAYSGYDARGLMKFRKSSINIVNLFKSQAIIVKCQDFFFFYVHVLYQYLCVLYCYGK